MIPYSVRNAHKRAPHGRLEDVSRGKNNKGLSMMPNPATATDTATLTPAQLAGNLINATPTAAANYTLPTAADLLAFLGGTNEFPVGDSFEFNISNLATTAAFDITVLTNTGWTLVGHMRVDARESTQETPSTGRFWLKRTGDAAFTLYRSG